MAQENKRNFLDIYRKHNGCCVYCGRQTIYGIRAPFEPSHLAATLDHVVPLARGGSNARSNLVLACSECNQHKADTPLAIWEAALKLYPEWWAKAGGGAALRRYLASAIYPAKELEWTWFKELTEWTLAHSTYDAKLFFTRNRSPASCPYSSQQ